MPIPLTASCHRGVSFRELVLPSACEVPSDTHAPNRFLREKRAKANLTAVCFGPCLIKPASIVAGDPSRPWPWLVRRCLPRGGFWLVLSILGCCYLWVLGVLDLLFLGFLRPGWMMPVLLGRGLAMMATMRHERGVKRWYSP